MSALVHRHPLITVAALAVAGAAVVVLLLVLVVVPFLDWLNGLPATAVHAYQGYWNGVGQQFQQWQQHGGRP